MMNRHLEFICQFLDNNTIEYALSKLDYLDENHKMKLITRLNDNENLSKETDVPDIQIILCNL